MSQSDVVLEDSHVRVVGAPLTVEAADLCLDEKTRRSAKNKQKPRRALVHDFNDGLTLNWDHDYPGGTFVRGPVKGDHGLFLEGECVLVRRVPKPRPQRIARRVPSDTGSAPDLAHRPDDMTVTLTPNTSLWETGIKKRAEEVFGAADYEAIEVFTALKSLLERVAKLEGQLAASGR